MDKQEAAEQIRRIIRRELDAAESALNDEDIETAASELTDAIRKLKRLASELD